MPDVLTIAYLIPEFPGQTHVWMWREIESLRGFGARIVLFSTRRPPAEVRARHAFADAAARETRYLWPTPVLGLAAALLWALARPARLLSALRLALSLDVEARPRWRAVLPLLVPAAVLARAMAARGARHLHVHSCSNSAVIAMLARRLSGVPYSMTLNADIEWWGGAMGQKFAEADFTLAITEKLLAQIRRDHPGLRPEQALLGRIGVDTVRWTPAPRAASSGAFRVVSVARLHATKGHDLLIRSIHALRGRGRNVELRLIGAGPEREALEALIESLELRGNVVLCGSLAEHEIIEEMKRADAFVLASHAEPLGVAYMEAMAMELPSIGTAAGGVPEIIADGDNGLLVPPHDEAALAAAIARLIDEPELRRRLGERGRQSIIERFDSRLGAATLHRRLLASHPPRG